MSVERGDASSDSIAAANLRRFGVCDLFARVRADDESVRVGARERGAHGVVPGDEKFQPRSSREARHAGDAQGFGIGEVLRGLRPARKIETERDESSAEVRTGAARVRVEGDPRVDASVGFHRAPGVVDEGAKFLRRDGDG